MKSQRTRQSFGAQQDAPNWLFLTIVVATLSLLKIALSLDGFAGVGALFAYIGLIGVAAFLWGSDSRDASVNL